MQSTSRTDLGIQAIIRCAIAVHREFGPGLLESVYQACMLIELASAGLPAAVKQRVPLVYKGQKLAEYLELDLIVEDQIIVELKAVENLHPVHLAQLITYLKLTGRPAGLLINFNSTSLRLGGLRRVTNPALYVRK